MKSAFEKATDPISKADFEKAWHAGKGVFVENKQRFFNFVLFSGDAEQTTGWGWWAKTTKIFRIVPMMTGALPPEGFKVTPDEFQKALSVVKAKAKDHSEPTYGEREIAFVATEKVGTARYMLRKTGERIVMRMDMSAPGQPPFLGYAFLSQKLALP